jgi:O-antigen/teichoic acid export membrane protein
MNPVPLRNESLTWRAGWLTLAKTAGFAFSLALPLLLVRRMDPEQYGLYKQVFLVVTTAMIVLPLGFQMSAYYFLPLKPGRQREIIANIMLFNVAAGLLAFLALLCYPSLLVVIFRGPQLLPYAPWIGVAILFWITGAFLETAPIANQEIQAATIIIVGVQATRALVFIAAAAWYGTVRALIYAAILHGMIQTVVLLVYLESRFRGFWHSFDKATLRSQLLYAVPLGSAGLLLIVETDFHSYFIARQFSPAIFAVYMVGTFQLPLIGLLQEAANSVLIGRVSILQQQQQPRKIILLTARAARKLASVYFPLYAFLLIAGRELIQLLFTNQYAESWPIFAVNLTLLPLNVLLLDPLFRAYQSERFFLLRLRIAVVAALMIALSLWTRRLGLLGVISLVVAAGVVERTLAALHFGRLLGLTRRDIFLLRDFGKLGLASLVAALVAAPSRSLLGSATPLAVLVMSGTIFGAVYLAAIHLLRVLSPDERAHFKDAVARYLPRPLRYELE